MKARSFSVTHYRSGDPIPDRLSPQLATLVSAPPSGGGWTYEIKFDGYRILARCDGRSTRLYTRNGNDWTSKMSSLAKEVSSLPVQAAWLDGEVIVLGDDGVPSFNALQNAFDSSGTESIVFYAFDVLYLDGKDLRGLPFKDRRAALEGLFTEFALQGPLEQTRRGKRAMGNACYGRGSQFRGMDIRRKYSTRNIPRVARRQASAIHTTRDGSSVGLLSATTGRGASPAKADARRIRISSLSLPSIGIDFSHRAVVATGRGTTGLSTPIGRK